MLPATSQLPLIVCPLEYERRCLARAGLGYRSELHTCGPGAESAARWCSSVLVGLRPVILAGVAGALRPGIELGTARAIDAVVRPGISNLVPPMRDDQGWTIASARSVLHTPRAKQQFADEANADLVDMEARAFAECASERGWRWGIVRGVSDPLEMTLPVDIESWVDSRGRSRPLRIAASLALHPLDVARAIRLARQSGAAMRSVARCIEHLLDHATRGAP